MTPLVKHKIVKKRTAPFRRYQSDRKVTVKVRARAGSRALPLRVSETRALTIAMCAARVQRHDARRSGPAVGVACPRWARSRRAACHPSGCRIC